MSSRNKFCYHLSHNLLLTRVGLRSFTNRVLVYRRLLISDSQGHKHISQSWVCCGECNNGTYPPPHSNFVLTTQYYSITDVNVCLSHLPQKLHNLMFTQHLSFPAPVSSRQFLWRRRTTEWCRIQLRCLVIRSRDKTFQISVSKDAFSVVQSVATLLYKPEGRGIDSRWRRLGLFID